MTLNESLMSLEIGLIYGIVAIGIYLTFRIIDFPDLTCDGSFVLGAASSGILIKAGYNPWLSLLGAFLSGGVAGLATGALHTRLKITDLLSGILVAFMLYSINLHIMKGIPNITLFNEETIFTKGLSIPILLLVCFIVLSTITYLLYTDFGLALRSIGQNKRLAQNKGISISVVTIFCLSLSNGLIALGGALFSQHQGFSDIGSGIGTVIIGLASLMVGERLFPKKALWIQLLGCMVGSILYRFLIALALHSDRLGLETQDLNLLTGLMVVGIMIMPRKRKCSF